MLRTLNLLGLVGMFVIASSSVIADIDPSTDCEIDIEDDNAVCSNGNEFCAYIGSETSAVCGVIEGPDDGGVLGTPDDTGFPIGTIYSVRLTVMNGPFVDYIAYAPPEESPCPEVPPDIRDDLGIGCLAVPIQPLFATVAMHDFIVCGDYYSLDVFLTTNPSLGAGDITLVVPKPC